MTAAAPHDANVDAWRAHQGLPVAPADLTARQKLTFEKSADFLIANGVRAEMAAATALDKTLSRGEFAPQSDAEGAAPTWPDALDLAALADAPIPEREYRVGEIMPMGTVGLLTRHGGIGKTQLALHLALCLALGRPFYGETVQPARVAFVSGEDDARELHYRAIRQCEQLRVSLAALAGCLFVYDVSQADMMLVTDGDGQIGPTARYWQLMEELERRHVKVLILDNLMALFAGSVNDPAYAARALALLARLVPAGGNVVVLGHIDKATARVGYSLQAYTGTAGWHNRARWRWFLFAPNLGADAELGEEPEGDDGRRVLEVQKLNGGKPGARIALRFGAGGALVPDGPDDGIVASIARNNERKAVVAAVREAEARAIPIPTAETNRATAYEALETMPSYPAALRGKAGKRRLFRLLRQLRADGDIEVAEFVGAGRHRREGYRICANSK